jgi:hypothetical protein
MKKSLILIATAILALTLLAGCAQPTTPATSTTPPESTSTEASVSVEASTTTATPGAPSATDVWQTTIASNAYKSWPTAPGYSTMQPAKGPHGKFVQIYVNPTVQTTLSGSAATTWPTGAMIVKDAYDADKKLISIEYMQKTDGGWYYASFTPEGTAKVEGVKVEPCEGCHTKNSSDGVKSFKLPQ